MGANVKDCKHCELPLTEHFVNLGGQVGGQASEWRHQANGALFCGDEAGNKAEPAS